ncbi:MAG: tRNA pseudouridine(38-40) synthase TruA [Thermacetogeniaceae bacterium]
MKRWLKLTLEYEGTGFSGWQKQTGTNLRTVQGVLDAALEQLTGVEHLTVGAGRTDAGVHALGQVVNFATESGIPTERWPAALNGLLPSDVAISSAEEVDDSFHARCSAKAKEYCYLILNRQQRSAIWHNYSYHVPQTLDQERMAQGADCFRGTHDFKAFSAVGSSARSTARQVFASNVFRNGDWVGFRVAANGFLYKMVRLMTGMLVEIGLGRADPARIGELLASGARGEGGPTLPPRGLFLVRIAYREEPDGLITSRCSQLFEPLRVI